MVFPANFALHADGIPDLAHAELHTGLAVISSFPFLFREPAPFKSCLIDIRLGFIGS
jgi:hypothetical protein